VASAINDDAMLDQGLSVGNTMAVIGKASGGQPQTALVFGSPDQAKAVLRKGELLEAVIRAFNPSNETGGPESVTAIRIDPAVQSTLQLRDTAAAVVATLTSTGYGLGENQNKVKVEAATGGRGLKLTTQNGTSYYTADNVLRNAFSLHYTGAQASGVLGITGTSVTLEAPSGTNVATIDLNAYPTVQELVDRINAVTGFAAAVLDGNGAAATLQGLDFVTAQDVKTATYTARADLQAVVDWFNSAGEGFCGAVRPSEVGTLPAAIPFTYFAGGTDGTVMNTDWSNGFSVLQTVDVQWVVPVSSDPSIHAMADAHVQFMSTVGKKERRAIVGSPLSTADAAAIALAKAINSDRTSLVHLGGYDFNFQGALKLYPPYIVAAMIAGGFCGLSPGEAMTAKSLNLRGLERKLRVPTDTDALLLGGVLPLEDDSDGYRVVQSISTWLTDSKFNRREQSCGVALDFTVRATREALKPLKGGPGIPTQLGLAVSLTKTALTSLAVPAPNGPGVLAGDVNSPAFKNISATLVGDVIAVTYECSPVIPTNYVTLTVYAKPYSGSASAAA
jgi:hypothetical protein